MTAASAPENSATSESRTSVLMTSSGVPQATMSPSRSHERTMAVVWRRYSEVFADSWRLLRASIWRMADFARKSAFSASSASWEARTSSSGAFDASTSARAISTTSQSSAR